MVIIDPATVLSMAVAPSALPAKIQFTPSTDQSVLHRLIERDAYEGHRPVPAATMAGTIEKLDRTRSQYLKICAFATWAP